MKPKTALIASLIGTVVVAVCCFTPILVLLLGTVGLGALIGSLDYVLIPALGVMLGLTVFSYWQYRRHCNCKHE
ncbi:mercury resistance system transport protein MerF [Fischerella thermalis]|uniref:mercury resistance system transport protein MerF n=1 Tax=Fischerella thermalis TaxID=372787 RepID=UPI001A00947D|nr:mercury resistance system transport protein MerF [Fischerella thermalis]MBF1989847.1 mercury resistance system transport protein MerF [Fischerella thermalis M58_A2018_009]MBF2061150.1 mercury resistance system transport protein MerF [Fischerella thermalis M66_A2018_004]MBF2069990.1 mercury resistance system transport protein MerF [Fischerella thermalis M48_A2018_028]